MKKTIMVIFVVALMVLAFSAVVSAAEKSKADYYYDIDLALTQLREALASGDLAKISAARKALRKAIYAATRYLASVGEYDARLEDVVKLADKATYSPETFEELIEDAKIENELVFETGKNPVQRNEPSSHS